MPKQAEYLRAMVTGRAEGVDKSQRVLRGYVAAQEGPFKSQGRGYFDRESLTKIVQLANANRLGLKSRLGHPTMSDDGVGKFLGRGRDYRMGTAINADGKKVAAVRGDLFFDKTASNTPNGNLSDYVLNLAESDPDAISSSLVLETEEKPQVDPKGKPLLSADGEELPPLWLPKKLHASDIVDTGDAVDGLLSAPQLAQALSVGVTPELQGLLRFDNVARLSTQLLDGMFKGASKQEVERRCRGWLERYLAYRFGLAPGEQNEPPGPSYLCKLCGGQLACLECGWRGAPSMPMSAKLSKKNDDEDEDDLETGDEMEAGYLCPNDGSKLACQTCGWRFGDSNAPEMKAKDTPQLDKRKLRMDEQALALRKLGLDKKK